MFQLSCSLRNFMGIPLIFWIIHCFSHCFKGNSHMGNLGEEEECIFIFFCNDFWILL
jgi:hypothetical protein